MENIYEQRKTEARHRRTQISKTTTSKPILQCVLDHEGKRENRTRGRPATTKKKMTSKNTHAHKKKGVEEETGNDKITLYAVMSKGAFCIVTRKKNKQTTTKKKRIISLCLCETPTTPTTQTTKEKRARSNQESGTW